MPLRTEVVETNLGKYRVELYYRDPVQAALGAQGARHVTVLPHGFEVTTPATTNESGYFRTGGLVWQGNELIDFDGCYFLPRSVAQAILRRHPDVKLDMELFCA